MSKKTTTTTTTTVVTTTVEDIVKKETTYYTFILDRSGSMRDIQKATIDSFNEQIGTLKRLQNEYPEQKYIVSLVIFDDEIETVVDSKPVNEVALLTESTYGPRGGTALRDAIGKTIADIKIKHGSILTEQVDSTEAFVVVLTDGHENASKEYSVESVKNIINEVQEKKNWSITFIGSDQKSITEAKSYGIHSGNMAMFTVTNAGMKTANIGMSNIHARRAYASSLGASLDNTNYMAAVTDINGTMMADLNLTDIDEMLKNKENLEK